MKYAVPYNNCAIIQSNRPIGPDVYEMKVVSDSAGQAGQFYMLRREDGAVLLPRAISLCDADPFTLTFVYKVVGKGTETFSRLWEGDAIALTGPLGNGFPLDETSGKKLALVGGGVGVAPFLLTAKRLHEAGNPADCYLGYPDQSYLHEEIGRYAKNLHIATENGAGGHKGFVTELLNPADYDGVFCCGPTPMMRAVISLCEKSGIPVWVSLENKMACGIGACLVCTCADKEGNNHRVCKDGPVFRGEGLNFDA